MNATGLVLQAPLRQTMHVTNFLVNVHRLIQQTIPCHNVTLTKSTPPHIVVSEMTYTVSSGTLNSSIPYHTPSYHPHPVKSLLRRRNKHRRNGRIEAANELSTKIGKRYACLRSHMHCQPLQATLQPTTGTG